MSENDLLLDPSNIEEWKRLLKIRMEEELGFEFPLDCRSDQEWLEWYQEFSVEEAASDELQYYYE